MTKLTWEEHMKIVNANTGLGQALTLSSESFKKLNQKLLEARKKKQKRISLQARKRVGPPIRNQGPSVDSLQALGYYRIMNEAKRYKKMIKILTSKKFQKNFMKLCSKKKLNK